MTVNKWVCVIVAAIATPVSAEFTGNELQSACRPVVSDLNAGRVPARAYETGLCMSFIDGFVGAMILEYQFRRARGDRGRPTLCIPREGTLSQAIRIVAKRMDAHPEELHREATYSVGAALIEAFPCE